MHAVFVLIGSSSIFGDSGGHPLLNHFCCSLHVGLLGLQPLLCDLHLVGQLLIMFCQLLNELQDVLVLGTGGVMRKEVLGRHNDGDMG